jgi:phage-related protein
MNHVNSKSLYTTTDQLHAIIDRVSTTIDRVSEIIGQGIITIGKIIKEIITVYDRCLSPYKVKSIFELSNLS